LKELVDMIDRQMKQRTAGALAGNTCVLGTITSNGVKLDDFKHAIDDPMYADWTVKLEVPQAARTVITASPVKSDPKGNDMDDGSTLYSSLTRIDFHGEGGVGEALKVHIDLKSELKSGDRVLVVPINGGQDCVILCKVVT